jgi:hypothetical protein
MALIDLLKKGASSLGLNGVKPEEFEGQESQLEKVVPSSSELDLNGKTPEKYSDNKPE